MTRPLNIALLGATGSIGRQTLDVIDRNPARFKLFGLTEGTRSSERNLGVDTAHEGELRQPLGFHVDVGAGVQQDGHAREGGDRRRERRPLAGDAFDTP